MCSFWFNTSFIERNYLVFEKSVIDKAIKDKANANFSSDFKIELYLNRAEDEDLRAAKSFQDEDEENLDENDEDEWEEDD